MQLRAEHFNVIDFKQKLTEKQKACQCSCLPSRTPTGVLTSELGADLAMANDVGTVFTRPFSLHSAAAWMAACSSSFFFASTMAFSDSFS